MQNNIYNCQVLLPLHPWKYKIIHHTNSITIYKLYIPYNLMQNNIYNCQVLLPLHPWKYKIIHHTNSITIYKLYIPYNLTYNNIYNCQVLLPLHPWQPFNIPLVNISMLSLRANAGIFFFKHNFRSQNCDTNIVQIEKQILSKRKTFPCFYNTYQYPSLSFYITLCKTFINCFIFSLKKLVPFVSSRLYNKFQSSFTFQLYYSNFLSRCMFRWASISQIHIATDRPTIKLRLLRKPQNP